MSDETNQSTALTPFEQRMMDDAADQAAAEKGGPSRLSLRDKKFSIDDLSQGSTMQVVILQAAFDNAYYKGKFNPKKPVAPDCYALGYDEAALAPPADLETKVADACGEPGKPGCCPFNEWGSGDGNGKKCKNQRRIAAVLATEAANPKATVFTAEMPPKSGKGLSKYLKKLTKLVKKPSYAVITGLSFDDDETYPLVEFTGVSEITDRDTLINLMGLADGVKAALVKPFVRAAEKDDDEPSEITNGKKPKF